jgi:tRNA-splicing ligase RtcB
LRIIIGGKIPAKVWFETAEDSALAQISNLCNLPFAFHHVAVMSDCHTGYGMPIGGVLATEGVIIPNCVGVDIGCGMCAAKTSLNDIDIETLKKIMGLIRERIPLGFNHHKNAQLWEGFHQSPNISIIQRELNSAKYQLATLGGGNHFIEIQKSKNGFIWLMLHSGSRNFGLKIAKTYYKKAKELCERWYSNISNKDLSFLPLDSIEANEYIQAMNYALEFAKQNRTIMMEVVKQSISDCIQGVTFESFIDVHHNYAILEHHFGKNVVIHRKGAIRAREGDIGIIPGSQGSKSYIVQGKGNLDSFTSASHGAGRKMGRNEARHTLNLKDEIKKLDEKGILHAIREIDDLDEASSAYKDIEEVMKQQEDLVKIIEELTPLAVIK